MQNTMNPTKTLLALNSVHPATLRHRHIAGLFRGRELIAVGFNQRKSHPLQARFGKNKDSIYLHAEIHCIANALKVISYKELKHCTLYVIRIQEQGLTNSAPCKGCTSAINAFNIGKVVHS